MIWVVKLWDLSKSRSSILTTHTHTCTHATHIHTHTYAHTHKPHTHAYTCMPMDKIIQIASGDGQPDSQMKTQ